MVQNGGLTEVPEELCDFVNYRPPEADQGWWEGNELIRIDLTNNKITSINEKLAS